MMQVINRMNKNRMMDQIEFMDQINHTNAIGHMWGILGGYNLPIVNNKSLTFLDWFHKNFWSCGYTTPTIISNIIIKPSFALPYLSTLIRVFTFHSLDIEFSKSFPLMEMNSPSKVHTIICSTLVLVLQGCYVKWWSNASFTSECFRKSEIQAERFQGSWQSAPVSLHRWVALSKFLCMVFATQVEQHMTETPLAGLNILMKQLIHTVTQNSQPLPWSSKDSSKLPSR
jgi:hypothetical protein